jgi:hypothetical protein
MHYIAVKYIEIQPWVIERKWNNYLRAKWIDMASVMNMWLFTTDMSN